MHLPALPDDPAHFHAILAALPGNFLLLLPDAPAYTIVTVSEELLHQTGRQAAEVVGQSVFVAYPESEQEANTGPTYMRLALEASLRDQQAHELPLVRYDVPTADGRFEVRYWSGRSRPVLDARGQVLYLLFTSQDLTAQRRAVQQAAESEARFRALVEQAPVAISLTRGPEVIIEAINEPMLRLMHQPNAAAVLGRRMVEVLPELESQAILHIAQEVTQTGQAFAGSEFPVTLRVNGEMQAGFYNVSYTPLWEQGRVTGLIQIAHDVTEQVRARQRVERSEQEWRTLTDAIDQLVWTADAGGEILFFNAQWYGYTGSTWEQSRGEGWAAYFHPDDLPTVQQQWAASRQQGTPYQQEARLRSAAGRYRWFLIRAQTLRDTEGRVVKWFGTNTDIDERRRHEQELAGVGELVRATLDSSADMVQVFDALRDADGRIVDFRWRLVNAVAAANYGVDVVGQRLRQLNPGIVEAGIFERFVQVVETGVSQRYEQEYRHEQYNGWFDQSAVRLGDGLVTTTADITARKRAEQALFHSQQQLEASIARLTRTNADLDNFIYTASHDLKAPISNIEGLLLALEHELPPAGRVGPVSEMLSLMHGAVERFQRTIGHLTDLTKLQREFDQPSTQVVLARLIEEVRLDLAPLLDQTRAQIEVQVPASLTVSFSEKNLRSVVYNLLSNALKYRHPDRVPEVVIRYRPHSDYQVLEVQDNGLGLDLSHGQPLFGLFQRLHTHVEGTGVGLYMVKKILENAGGRIEVLSALDQGSTFRVYLPR